jgi:hypothetical protein
MLDSQKAKKKLSNDPKLDKFIDPVDPMFPPAISSWGHALQDFDPATAQFTHKPCPNDVGYAFPEPAMFLRAQSLK